MQAYAILFADFSAFCGLLAVLLVVGLTADHPVPCEHGLCLDDN